MDPCPYVSRSHIRYKVLLNSDDNKYGGHGRLDPNAEYFSFSEPWHDRPHSLLVWSEGSNVVHVSLGAATQHMMPM